MAASCASLGICKGWYILENTKIRWMFFLGTPVTYETRPMWGSPKGIGIQSWLEFRSSFLKYSPVRYTMIYYMTLLKNRSYDICAHGHSSNRRYFPRCHVLSILSRPEKSPSPSHCSRCLNPRTIVQWSSFHGTNCVMWRPFLEDSIKDDLGLSNGWSFRKHPVFQSIPIADKKSIALSSHWECHGSGKCTTITTTTTTAFSMLVPGDRSFTQNWHKLATVWDVRIPISIPRITKVYQLVESAHQG